MLCLSLMQFSSIASRQAADAGDVDAMAHLGHAYANGLGTAPSNASALHWFRAAAERGAHPSALYGLGYLHLSGAGVPKDAKRALKFFTSASEQARRCLCLPWGLNAGEPE